MKMRNNKSGFTLVELMVVAVIVAILAAVAIPLMSANKKRAIATEAESALGTIRSTLRAQYAETSAYDTDINGNSIADGSSATNLMGISEGDLNGRYFTDECYVLTTLTTDTYLLTATGSSSTNTATASEIDGMVITLDETGTFNRSGF